MSSNSITFTEDTSRVSSSNSAVVFNMDALLRHSHIVSLEVERKKLLKQIYEMHDQYVDFVSRSSKTVLERLQQEREEIVLQCRAAKKHFDKVSNKAGLFDETTRRLNQETNIASLKLLTAKETQLVPAYSTQADYDAHAEKIAGLQVEFDRKLAEYQSHLQMISTIERDISNASEAHNNLVKRELELRQQIQRAKGDKSPIIDRETGLER